ncbi:potassium channel family protein [Paracoccus aerodenitrificans]|uniref:potassium channel family protein n=1 Tax=Paracoccus aerodenitrificans TaxID=3017781 RepID=UPI0022F103B6|nr:potassium channel family protein [Paracoccus aerodenitrificans]WBU63031.1 potassium channel family protein [Paracoccus aerodenitrificans]
MTPMRDLTAGISAAFASRRVQRLLALTALLITIASVFYALVEGWRWIDAVYFSVIAISTVGFGDFAPQTDLGKIFTIIYVLLGLGMFVATATAIGDSIMSRAENADGRSEEES